MILVLKIILEFKVCVLLAFNGENEENWSDFWFSLVKNLKKVNPLFPDLAFQPRFHKPAAG